MKELSYFRDPANPEITAAMVGISKYDWTCVGIAELKEDAIITMRNGRFDVLPITGENGDFIQYYTTSKWGRYNWDNVGLKAIKAEDRIYYRTALSDVIHLFHLTSRKFYFLDNHSDIIGLITLGNLNCKHVYLFLYNKIIQLEKSMASFIYKHAITDKELVLQFKERRESKNAIDAIYRYNQDQKLGFDFDFLEYIYITDLCFIFKKYDLTKLIEYKKGDFERIIAKINEIRKVVAHPNRSLIRDIDSIHVLWETIVSIEILMERLNRNEH